MHTPVIERIRQYYQIPNASIFMEDRKPDDRQSLRRKTIVWGLDPSLLDSRPNPTREQEEVPCQQG